jgi:hypothetical protein
MDSDCPPPLPPFAQEVITILKSAAKLSGFTQRALISPELIHNVQPWRYAIFTILAANGHSTTQIGEAFARTSSQIRYGIKSSTTSTIKQIASLLTMHLASPNPAVLASIEHDAKTLMTPPLRKVRTS